MPLSRVILVAEDEDNDFLLLERAFAKHDGGVSVARARDGVEVMNYLTGVDGFEDRRRHPLPDLLLLDLKMPRKDGFETLEWIRSQPAFRSAVVVVFSSSTQDRDIRRAYDLGANSYLAKPNDYAGLFDLVRILTQYWLRYSRVPQWGNHSR